MRWCSRWFFSWDEDEQLEIVRAAYWLAYTYHVDPGVFLAQTPDEVAEHLRQTSAMLKLVHRR